MIHFLRVMITSTIILTPVLYGGNKGKLGHMSFNIFSNYYDLTTYNKLFSINDNKLNIVQVNCRSIPEKIDSIKVFPNCLSISPDILVFPET